MRAFAAWLTILVALPTSALGGEAPPDPLRLLPRETDLLLEVPQPGKFVHIVTALDAFQRLRKIEVVQDFLDSTNYRRLYQLLAYFEKELGAKWPDLLDRLTGGGVALGVKLGPQPAPATLVVQSRDEALLQKFATLGLEVLAQTAAQDDAKNPVEKGEYRKVVTTRIGKDLHAAVLGSALVASNTEKGLQHAIDVYLDGVDKSLASVSGIDEARKLLPPEPLARVWLNLETVRQAPEAKEAFSYPRNDQNLTILLGGPLDVARRAPFLCAGVYRDAEGFVTTVRMPRGREGMADGLQAHVPPAGQPGSKALLEPKGVIYSASFYLDFGQFWEQRGKMFTEQQVKAFEDAVKNSGRFLAGHQVSTLLNQAGAYNRFVVAHQFDTGYKRQAKIPIPSFAVVVEPREPEAFAKAMNTIVRGAALLAGFNYNLKLIEEKHGEHLIVGYRFPEDGKFPGDDNDLRFNFTPCFVSAGKHFVFSSTLELARELVDLLEQEAKSGTNVTSPSTLRSKAYSQGAAAYVDGVQDFLVAQFVLGQALSPAAARKQAKELTDWLRGLGRLEIDSGYGANDWHYDIRAILGK